MAIDHEPRDDRRDDGDNGDSGDAGGGATGASSHDSAGRPERAHDAAEQALAPRIEQLRRQSHEGTWALPSVGDVPAYSLVDWRILERDGERHFVGRDAEERVGRVSSAIRQFDPVTRRGATRSGRHYTLLGPPGWDADAAYVLEAWLAINRVSPESVRDVSDEMLGLAKPFDLSEGA